VEARTDDEVVVPDDPGATSVAARDMDDRRSRGGDRSGEGLIEGVKHVEGWLGHEKTPEGGPVGKASRDAVILRRDRSRVYRSIGLVDRKKVVRLFHRRARQPGNS
jgi:hypothetical protein